MSAFTEDSAESEERFVPILKERLGPLLALRRSGSLGARLWSLLAEESRAVESFLEDYGARDNARFLYIIELVSSLRGFAIASYTLRLVEKRLGQRYSDDPTGDGSFSERLSEALRFVEGVGYGLLSAVVEERRTFRSEESPTTQTRATLPDPGRMEVPRFRLPRTLDPEHSVEPNHEVIAIASKLLAVHRILERQKPERNWQSLEDRRQYVRDVSDEQQCRFFETRILNLIARYDTSIRGTQTEKEQPGLTEIRAGLGLMRRVARVMTELVHFHERYERDLRSNLVRDRIGALIKEEELLHCVLDFCMTVIASTCAQTAVKAEELLGAFTQQASARCELPDGVQMHVRPVSMIAKIVQHHGTPVVVHIADQSCYAGSVVQFLMLAASHPELRSMTFEGDREVLRDLELFFSCGLGERGPLPTELGYLRR